MDREKGNGEMSIAHVPEALVERLGPEGAEGLVEFMEFARADWKNDVLTIAAERFERRLTAEISGLRIDVTRELAAFRVEIAGMKVELLKWSFLFWIGQVAAMAALLAFMLRT